MDAEAAKKATDLVLDSLKNQRDTPDPDLLNELGWTPDRLQRFMDRWEKTRKLADSPDAIEREQSEETLKSLGIRPPQDQSGRKSVGRDDSLGEIQDAGSKIAAPPQFRGAIEAYRRSLQQGNRP